MGDTDPFALAAGQKPEPARAQERFLPPAQEMATLLGHFPNTVFPNIDRVRLPMSKREEAPKTGAESGPIHAVRRFWSQLTDCTAPPRSLLKRAFCYLQRVYTA